ncbi:hypothetical protein LHK_01863 [Laribacter hongkongensis HLHK9]|uniref:Uncharacterized protein n=1 Tax=Laribacter hongkongensis (strain HLHK9) TaxID=557598 RepID=C1D8Q7_LARHH|nr:hypothetical protein LHK_01863 [Laribacter hongkongensis HLHK9]
MRAGYRIARFFIDLTQETCNVEGRKTGHVPSGEIFKNA